MRIVVGILLVAVIAGCGDSDAGQEELLVSAAASLTDSFAVIEHEFEEANPGVDVVLNLAGSSALREQILGGAPADVFASANIANMEQVVAAGEISGQPEVFATNRLQIAVSAGNPAGIEGLEDFADESLFLGLCAEGVPCGDLAREALANAGVVPSIDTSEPDVRSLLTKVAAGELDAGITYLTDVLASDSVDGVDVPDGANVLAEYTIAVLAQTENPEMARAFVEFVQSEVGQDALAAHGFSTP